MAAFYGSLLAFGRPTDGSHRANLARVAGAWALTVGLYLAFLVWRRMAYGAWLPNTYYAKLDDGPSLTRNVEYLVGAVLPYRSSFLFALSAAALAPFRSRRRLAGILAVFTIASLVRSIVGGRDPMGRHRFATPFFAMAHVGVAVLVATALTWRATGRTRVVRSVLVAITAGVIVVFLLSLRPRGNSSGLTSVTIARVAELHGAQRIEHQRRLGLINPVVTERQALLDPSGPPSNESSSSSDARTHARLARAAVPFARRRRARPSMSSRASSIGSPPTIGTSPWWV